MPVRRRFAIAILACAGLAGTLITTSPQLAAASTQPPAARPAIGAAQQHQLLRLYASYRHIPVNDIGGILPGSVRVTQVPRTGTDWASVGFRPATHAPQNTQVGFQDGGGYGIFTRTPGGRWKVAGLGGEPFGCGIAIPAAVRHAWHLAGCAAPASPSPAPSAAADGTMSGLASIARAQVGVSDTPPDPSGAESTDCNPYTAKENPSAPTAGCGIDPKFNIRDAAEFWCADFTKWVWAQAGVTSDLGVLTPAAASFYTWGKDHGESMPEDQNPKTAQVGDAVVFYPGTTPNGSYADHVGIVVGVNSDGTLELVNGDFFGNGTYSVQDNVTTPSLAAWASAVWNDPNEDWIFVSPKLSSGPGGGVSAASAAVYDQASGHLEVYGTGTNGHLEESYYTGSDWTAWKSLGGSITGVPDAVYDPVTGNLEVYAAGTNGKLDEFYWNSAGWHTAELKGSITASPSAVYDQASGNLEVYARGTGGTLEEIYYTGTAWSSWKSLGGAIVNSPSAVYDPLDSSLEVYAAGTSHALREFYWNSAGWHTANLHTSINSSPSAVYDPVTKNLEVYMTATDGTLAESYWNPTSQWETAHLKGDITNSPSAVYNQASGNLEVYARGAGGTLAEIYYNGTAWSQWQITAAAITGSPQAVYDTATGNLEVYALTTGHTVTEHYWNTAGWHTANLHGNLSSL